MTYLGNARASFFFRRALVYFVATGVDCAFNERRLMVPLVSAGL